MHRIESQVKEYIHIWDINLTMFGSIVDRYGGPAKGLYNVKTQARKTSVYAISDQALQGVCIVKIDSTKSCKSNSIFQFNSMQK